MRITAESFASVERNSKALLASRNIGNDADLPEWLYQIGGLAAGLMGLFGFVGLIYPASMSDLHFWLALHGWL